MAYLKKCYRSVVGDTATHQSRGGGTTLRLNRPKRYPSNPVEKPESPTWLAARAAKKLPIHQRTANLAKPA